MKVAVIGVGQTKFGEEWNKSLRDLAREAGQEALKDASLSSSVIQSLHVGNMSAGRFSGQEHVSALVADSLNIKAPSVRCEAACASGALAFRSALHSIQAGSSNIAIALGVEKMSDLGVDQTTTTLMAASDQEWEANMGATFPGLYALIARAHMHQYGTTREQMALVSVNNHKNGSANKLAQFPFPVSVEQVLNSTMVADPLTLLDCSPITDGSAAIILASEDYVRQNNIENPIWVAASAQGNDTIALHDRSSLTQMDSVKAAAKSAYEQSGLTPEKINFAEVHDCFSINELVAIEGLGFCNEGESGKFVENGEISLQGSKPINTTGGLKSIGHPVGATGIRQIVDITKQLRENSINQLNSVSNGLALNVGGSGATAVIHILTNQL